MSGTRGTFQTRQYIYVMLICWNRTKIFLNIFTNSIIAVLSVLPAINVVFVKLTFFLFQTSEDKQCSFEALIDNSLRRKP